MVIEKLAHLKTVIIKRGILRPCLTTLNIYRTVMSQPQQLQQLKKQLWNIANDLRGKIGADEFRDYILGFIFYKYLSEKFVRYANDNILAGEDEGFDNFAEFDVENPEHVPYIEEVQKNAIEEIGYALAPNQLFHQLAKRGKQKDNFILDDLAATLKAIEQGTLGEESEEDFANLFDDIDLNSTKIGNSPDDRNEMIAKVLSHLDAIDFDLTNTESDVLGDAYEYLIGEFASGAGKKAGEFYTPQMVSTLLAKIVTQDKATLGSVYDPTCGSGSLLLRVKREADDVDMIYGQEMNRTTYNLARMNMILHNVHFAHFDIKQEDTLKRPQHLGKRFNAIVANPPFSANWSADPLLLQDERFSDYGKLAPKTKADMAFVQHMLHHLEDNGTMAVVLPHGVLFRGSSEGVIRQYLIEKLNVLDAVIGLPANIFYGTSIPTSVLVFKKNRKHNKDVLFIDASKGFEKQGNQNALLPEHLEAILAAYKARQDSDKFAYVAPLDEISDNDYNLNIPRYVDVFEAEEEIDLVVVAEALQTLKKDSLNTDALIEGFCTELGITSPFSKQV